MKKLIILESPNKIKTVQKYVGDDYILRGSYGHCIDLLPKELSVDIYNNFTPKYQIIPEKKDKLKAIVDAARNDVSEILIASDSDREGESIGVLLAEQLAHLGVPMRRLRFQEITKKALEEALKNPGELDFDLFDSQKCRRVVDRLVGYLVSPFLNYALNNGSNNSAGRVQSCVLKIIVDREREIEAFNPEVYFTITARLSKSDSFEPFVAKYSKKVTSQSVADKIKNDLEQDIYEVYSLSKSEKKVPALPAFTTSSLLMSSSSAYKFNSNRTMRAAQTLFELGFITYIRTDSTTISKDALEMCRDWLKNNKYDLPDKPNIYKNKDAAQEAHEAIRPTSITTLPKNVYLGDDEQKIYKLIWERFVASQMKPAIYDLVSLTVKSSSGHLLKSNGRSLKYKGWLEVTKGEEEDDENKLPILVEADKLILVPPKVKCDKKQTQPPSRYSEKTLIKELEKQGIGRPSTYATLMSKITERSYVERKGDMFQSTETGKMVVDKLSQFFSFMNIQYTAKMEEELDQIAEGKLSYLEMMKQFYDQFGKELKTAYDSLRKDYGFRCENCSRMMSLRTGRYGYYMACLAYPGCNYSFSCKVEDGKIIREDRALEAPVVKGVECPNCKKEMVQKNSSQGPFYSCVEFPYCKGSRKIFSEKKCSYCRSPLYYKIDDQQSLKLFCLGYPNCKNVEEIPENETKISWFNPKEFRSPKIDRKIKGILKK